ncbi:alpha/beta hydrolase [Streptomyces resistomycificus]|uniref:Alpha/beta hydrolase n=2 Tax=Streptomyces resistomycificus TaxID=67356 RepID=A0A0L8KXM4_9ACTN|nr:alpha/beta hydrolase [Streptomyces resistomycificus]KOG30564.1 alpha/beta hydrolase [Streptomyces resistomycificus]KUO02182.1 alpha/beta hydrolase [Streptomyces resistomycificus]
MTAGAREAGVARAARSRDGRELVFDSWGDPQGHPVFLLHGTPGSRQGPRPRSMVLYQLGIHLIAYDRPGYGGSTRKPGRQVVDAAADVADIAQFLGLDAFSVVGRSGGGPHALACAAKLSDRVSSAAVLVSLAPPDAEELDWFEGMTESNVREYRNARENLTVLRSTLVQNADAMRADPMSVLKDLDDEMPDVDRNVVADAGIRRMLHENFQAGIKQSADGWIDDAVAFSMPWGFDPKEITAPTLLWHGERDVFSPVKHFTWLAGRIEHATVVLEPSAAHFAAVPVLPKVLGWLREQAKTDAAAITTA